MSNREAFSDSVTLGLAGQEHIELSPVVHSPADVLDIRTDGFKREIELYAGGSRALGRPAAVVEDPPFNQLYHKDRETVKEGNRMSMNDRVARWAQEGDHAAYLSLVAVQYRSSPRDVLSEDNFAHFHDLARSVVGPPEERRSAKNFRTFRALNIYADIGKTDAVVTWARSAGIGPMDHDDIVVQLLEPGNEGAREDFLPSWDTLDTDQHESILEVLRSGFHIAQVQNGQATPAQLTGFFNLSPADRRLAIFSGICDIGGAQGDSVVSGSPTLTNSTYSLLRATSDILLDPRYDGMRPEEAAALAGELILQYRGEQFGGAGNGFAYDPNSSSPENMRTRALIRMGMGFRGLTPEKAATMRGVFNNDLDPVTQALCLDFYNTTGFEGRENGGAIWSMYSSTTADKVLKGAMRSGVPFEQAIASAMRVIARINSAALRVGFDDADLTNVVAYDLAKAADEDWRRLLQYDIAIRKFKDVAGQAQAYLQTEQPFDVDQLPVLGSLGRLAIPKTGGLWVAAGGGSDAYSAAFVAELAEQENPVVFSVWGEQEEVANATPLPGSDHIFIATAETRHGMRLTEDLNAARGVTTIFTTRRDNLGEDLRLVAQYLRDQGSPVESVNVVDGGGDLLTASTLGSTRPSRDHLSLRAAVSLQRHLGVTAGMTFVLAPGADRTPDMYGIVDRLRPHFHSFTTEDAALFQEWTATDGLPSADPLRYSRILDILWYLTHPRTRSEDAWVVQPHNLPVSQAVARHGRGRPAFSVIQRFMAGVLVFDTNELADDILA